jgi:hypothetical protein
MGPRTDLDNWKNDCPQSAAQNLMPSPWSSGLSPGHCIDWAVSPLLGFFCVTKKSKYILQLKHRYYLKLRIMKSVHMLFSCISDNKRFNTNDFFLKTSCQIFLVVLGLNEETCVEAPTLFTRFATVWVHNRKHAMAQLFEAPLYKPEDRGFDFR